MARMTAPATHAGIVASIGYEGRDLDDFLRVLTDNGIAVLVDVRLTPMSRKPGFSKRVLAQALSVQGIAYRHVRELGNPKGNRAAFHNGSLAAGRQRYLAYLNNGSRAAYEQVIDLSRTTRVALLCVEADPLRCHRSCITDQAQLEHPDLAIVQL